MSKNKDRTPRRLHPDATAKAKELFGDIVENVWVTTWDYGNSSEDEIKERLARMYINCDEDRLDYDSQTIWIRFTNGKTLAFNNSEWGSIEVARIEDAYEA